jgi:CheY-like chemotaxis protein
VVDDNADLLDSLVVALRLLQHEVRSASCGEDALVEIETWQPDVSLVDVGMDGMSGYEVATRARERIGSRGLLIAMTGWGRPEDRAQALQSGFDQHVVKPVDLDRLRELLAAVQGPTPPPDAVSR